jgi:hypothetical protein
VSRPSVTRASLSSPGGTEVKHFSCHIFQQDCDLGGKLPYWELHNLCSYILSRRNPDSAVHVATGYGLEVRGIGVRVPVGVRFFSSPRSPDRLWGPPSLLFDGFREFFPRG